MKHLFVPRNIALHLVYDPGRHSNPPVLILYTSCSVKRGLLKTKSNSIKAQFSQRNLMVSDTRRCQHRRKAWPGPFAIPPSYHSAAYSRRSDSWKLREVKRGAKKIKTSEGEKGDRRSLAALPSPPLFFLRAASDYLNACNRLVIRTVWRL